MENVPLVIRLLVGGGLLLAGRKLFWLFVGGAGFLAGFVLAQEYLPDQTENVRLLLSVGVGLAGAVCVYVAQKIALSIGGFMVGGFLGVELIRGLLALAEPAPAAIFLLGGIIGLVLIHVIFDWALTLLSAVAGAYALGQLVEVGDTAQLVIVVVLAAFGVAVQRGMLGGQKEKGPPRGRPKKEARDEIGGAPSGEAENT